MAPAPASIPGRATLPATAGANRLTLLALALFHRGARDAILLQLGRRHETRGRQLAGAVLPRLPPPVVVLADNLQHSQQHPHETLPLAPIAQTHLEDVARLEGDAGLGARDRVVVERVVIELGPHVDLSTSKRKVTQ